MDGWIARRIQLERFLSGEEVGTALRNPGRDRGVAPRCSGPKSGYDQGTISGLHCRGEAELIARR